MVFAPSFWIDPDEEMISRVGDFKIMVFYHGMLVNEQEKPGRQRICNPTANMVQIEPSSTGFSINE
jgi:hypothetical protein